MLHLNKIPNNPYKITAKYDTKRDTSAIETEIFPTKLPFLTHIAAHFPNPYTIRPAEPLTSIEPTKLMLKAASQTAQGASSHSKRSQIRHHGVLQSHNLTRHSIHQHRLSRATLTLPKCIAKLRAVPNKTNTYPYRLTTQTAIKTKKSANINRNTNGKKPIPELPFHTQIAAHFRTPMPPVSHTIYSHPQAQQQ